VEYQIHYREYTIYLGWNTAGAVEGIPLPLSDRTLGPAGLNSMGEWFRQDRKR